MSSLPLVFEPNPLLHQQAAPVAELTPAIVQLVIDMKETMVKENGVGLAAPQIGHSVRIFVVAHKDGIKAFINPRITKKSWRTNVDEEGCLSIPGVFGPVRRHNSVHVRYMDEHGEQRILKAAGFFARVIQHEYDHIEGVLFTEKLEA